MPMYKVTWEIQVSCQVEAHDGLGAVRQALDKSLDQFDDDLRQTLKYDTVNAVKMPEPSTEDA